MQVKVKSRIVGEFNGWSGDTLFEFDNGQIWKQSKYKYKYKYKYRPKVEIIKDGSRHYLKVDCMSELIEVKKIH